MRPGEDAQIGKILSSSSLNEHTRKLAGRARTEVDLGYAPELIIAEEANAAASAGGGIVCARGSGGGRLGKRARAAREASYRIS